MSKAGFVQAVKARGKYFFYVRKSFRDENKKPKNKNIFSLGQKEKALSSLNEWVKDHESAPDVLQKYSVEDFKNWIEYVENKSL